MPNGGDSGRQLDRLQDQVDATRTELGEVAEAVNGLRELVTELTRRSWSEHQSDRWQAKLGSLETRLGMMETTIRSEVERMRAAAGAVDALADEFRSTVGDTQSLVGLASELGDRLEFLEGLERRVRGATQDVATTMSDQLEQAASDRAQRDRDLADRVAETLARASSELPSVEQRLTAQVSELRSGLDASNESGRRSTLDALRVLSTELEALESRLAASSPGERLEEIIGGVAQLRADQPQLASRLDVVANEVTALHQALAQPFASVEAISDRVDALAATLRRVV
jgi:uncharacterized coiled-coil DUF342 family protein